MDLNQSKERKRERERYNDFPILWLILFQVYEFAQLICNAMDFKHLYLFMCASEWSHSVFKVKTKSISNWDTNRFNASVLTQNYWLYFILPLIDSLNTQYSIIIKEILLLKMLFSSVSTILLHKQFVIHSIIGAKQPMIEWSVQQINQKRR